MDSESSTQHIPDTDIRSSSVSRSDKELNQDSPQYEQSSSTFKRNKKKPQKKNRKRPYRPAYLDVIQKQINELKQKAREDYEEKARLNLENENNPDETVQVTEKKRSSVNLTIEQLEELKVKLSTPEMLQRAGNDAGIYHQTGSVNNSNTVLGNNTSPSSIQFQERTLTLLHFFYIVRLAQQGFFTLISQSYPNVEPNALIHLCDKLVGGSLFAVKDPVEDIRTNKQNEVFTLLQKLHEGVDEPIDDQFTTTFENIHHLITHFIHSTMPTLPSSSQAQQQVPDNNEHYNGNEQQQLPPPIWLVVPFTGMINNGSNLSNLPNLTSSLSSATPSSWQHSKSKSKPLPPSFSEEPKNKHLKSYSIEVSPNNSASSSKWSNQYKQSSSSDHTSKSSTPLPTTPDITHENSPPTITSTTDKLVKEEDEDKEVEKDKSLSSTTSSKELSEPIVTAENEDLIIKDTDKETTNQTETLTNHKDNNIKEKEQKNAVDSSSSSGWGDNADQKEKNTKEKEENGWGTVKLEEESGWGSIKVEEDNTWGTIKEDKEDTPVWEGKLPDELFNPGDETITGEVTSSNWQNVDFNSPKHHYNKSRGGGSGYRSNGPNQRGGMSRGGYRPNNDFRRGDRRDDRRDDNRRGDDRNDSRRGGMRRAPGSNANGGWGKPLQRPPRSD